MTAIVAPPSNASKWQMGFNSAFKGLISISSLWLVQMRKPNYSSDSVIKIREGLSGTESTFIMNGNFRTLIWNLLIDVRIWCTDLEQHQILYCATNVSVHSVCD
jgi:hypothetical protein